MALPPIKFRSPISYTKRKELSDINQKNREKEKQLSEKNEGKTPSTNRFLPPDQTAQSVSITTFEPFRSDPDENHTSSGDLKIFKSTGKNDTSDVSQGKEDKGDTVVPTTPIVPAMPVARSYESAYADEIDRLLLELRNRDAFSYDHESDPRYSAYKKEYLREADRTAEDTMGLYAGMTGGMPSTAAVSAASQAANQYKAGLADKIPELYQLAYDTYLDEIAQSRRDLETLRDLDNTAYNRWYTENRDAIADARYADETAYNRKIYEEETAYNRQLAELARAAEEQEALIAEWKKGGTVLSAEQAAATGYPEGMTYKQYALATGEMESVFSDVDFPEVRNSLKTYLTGKKFADAMGTSLPSEVENDIDKIFNQIYRSAEDDAELEYAIEQLIGDDEELGKLYAEWYDKNGGMLG